MEAIIFKLNGGNPSTSGATRHFTDGGRLEQPGSDRPRAVEQAGVKHAAIDLKACGIGPFAMGRSPIAPFDDAAVRSQEAGGLDAIPEVQLIEHRQDCRWKGLADVSAWKPRLFHNADIEPATSQADRDCGSPRTTP